MALTRPKIWDLDTNVTFFTDSITVMNQGATSAAVDVGFLFNRANGLVSNVALYWSESQKSFVTAFTSNSGTTNSNISVSSYANLTVGSVLTLNGTGIYLSPGAGFSLNGAFGSSGQVLTATGTGGVQWSPPGGFTGGYVEDSSVFGSNLVANSTTSSSSTTTGALVVVGGAGISGNVFVGNVTSTGFYFANGAPFVSSTYGNTSVAAYLPLYSGTIGGPLTVDGNLTVAGNLMVSNVTYENQEVITTTEVVQGNVVAAASTPSTSTTTGALVVTGGVGIGGNVYSGNIFIGSGVTPRSTMISGNGIVLTDAPVYTSGGVTYRTPLSILLQPTSTVAAAQRRSVGVHIEGITPSTNTFNAGQIYGTRFNYVNEYAPSSGIVYGHQLQIVSNSQTAYGIYSSISTQANATSSTGVGIVSTVGTSATVAASVTGSQNFVSTSGTANGTATGSSTSSTINAGNLSLCIGYQSNATINSNSLSTHDSVVGFLSHVNYTSSASNIKNITGLTVSTFCATAITTPYVDNVYGINIGTMTPQLGGILRNAPYAIYSSDSNARTYHAGNITVGSTITASGNILAAAGTPSTSITTGALVVSGGAGISGNLYVGGNLYVAGNTTIVDTTISNSVTGNLVIGLPLNFTATGANVQYGGNQNGYLQMNMQNLSSGSSASTDYVATADNGNDTTNYIDLGINSSTYSQAGYSANYPNDGYVMVQGNGTNVGGNLILATMTGRDIVFTTNGQNTENIVARITGGNVLTVVNTQSATSTTTGAFRVAGGAGIAGALYAGSLYDNGNRVLTSFSSTGTGNLTVSVSNPTSSTISLPATGPGATSVGSSTAIPVITTDAYGRVAATSTSAVIAPAGTLTGTTLASGVTASSLTSLGVITSLSATTAVVTNFSTGNAVITSCDTTNFDATTGVITNFSTGNARISGGYADNFAIGANTKATGAFTTLIATGNVDLQNTVYGRGVYDNSVRVVSTSTGAGNLTISSGAINLPAAGPGAVSTGSGSAIPVITTDAYGRIAGISTASLTAITNLSSSGVGNITVSAATGSSTISLPATGPGAASVGSSTAIPVITTDAYGRVAGTSTAAVVAPAGTLSGTTLASGVTASSLTSLGVITSLSATTAVATNFSSGNITGTFNGTVTPTVATANVAVYESVTATTTSATFYPMLSDKTTGNTASFTASTLSHNPSTGVLSATTFSGSGASLTSLPAGQLSGTVPSAVLGNSTLYVGTTAVTLNRASANQSLTGISSVALPGATSGTITITPAAVAGTTAITVPASTGTLITTGDTGTVTSTMILDGTIVNGDINASAAIAVSKLAASTISGVTLGSNLNTLTIGTGLSGTSYNGSAAVTITNSGVLSVNGSTGAITGIATTSATLAQFAATTSAQLAGVISDETGSGALVFATSPSLTTPAIGAATGTSLTLTGALQAATKSFLIPHPTKLGKKLRYGSLEGPENGVYVRGKLKGSNVIELPEYWTKLVDPDSITVNLTPIGKYQKLYVMEIKDNKVYVGNENLWGTDFECFYTVYGERVDVDKLEVEID